MSRGRALALAARLGAAVALTACDPDGLLEAEAADCARQAPRALGARRATLVNAYFLQEQATRSLRRAGNVPPPVLDEVYGKARAMGVGMVRTWAFNDGPRKAGDSAMQVGPLQYDEVALRGMDWVLARAQFHGLKLVLPLGNGWSDYGGAPQYVAWAGLPAPREQDGRFFTHPEVVALYRAHLSRFLDRINTVDGHRYGDHPAVAAWEVLNEPRGEELSQDGVQLRAWIDVVAAHVKRLAPSHLVGTGEEGFDEGKGSSYALNVASPHIDFGGVHLFPETWGWPSHEIARRGAQWIRSRAELAELAGKPFIVGELGLRNDGALPLEARRAIYRGWMSCAQTVGSAAMGPWMLANDARPESWDPHTFYWRDGTAAADAGNRYVDVMIELADLLR